MALVTSGAISLGGADATRSVNCELGKSGTAQIGMNDADARTLAGKASGTIAMSDFYGKSSFTFPPTAYGQVGCGGVYLGTISAAGSCYYLFVAPNATGCSFGQWKTSQTCSGVGNERYDGYGNTYDHLNSADNVAGYFCATRTISGFSDWYLPALEEWAAIFPNRGSAPAGEAFSTSYWSSTEFNAACACGYHMRYGFSFCNGVKNYSARTRAIRREPV